eukprot:TRINITY_DN386_c0_g1_i1.p1 TRINITY_DN386_c0_g1~~TRINITY_DN386_c0_g1_i1.p1  ORF type:complete len:191 (-),score=57.07 TRINITY_DN386_c0_g1_i1:363-893(-)
MANKTFFVLLLIALAGWAQADVDILFEGHVFYPTAASTSPKIPGGTGPILGLVNDPSAVVDFLGTITAKGIASFNDLPQFDEVVLSGADRKIIFSMGEDDAGGAALEYTTDDLPAEVLEPTLHFTAQSFRGISLSHDFEDSMDNPYRLRIDGQLWVLVQKFGDFSVAASGYLDFAL